MNSDTTDVRVSDHPDEPTWGAPQPHRGWSKQQTLAAIGVAAVIAGFGGAAIYAATGSSSDAFGHGPGPGGTHRWNGPGRGTDGPGVGPSLHGQFVVSDGNGGFTTVLTQSGVLTAVSGTSITAESPDGFTQVYTITPGSPPANAQLAVNDTANIRATLSNGTATATTVDEDDAAGSDGPPPFGQ